MTGLGGGGRKEGEGGVRMVEVGGGSAKFSPAALIL